MDNPPHTMPSPLPASTVGRASIVQWSQRPVAATVGQEVVLMNLDRGRCYGLGQTGTDLWQKMSNPILVTDLLTQLEREYEVDRKQLEQDVLMTLQEYADEGLITVLGDDAHLISEHAE